MFDEAPSHDIALMQDPAFAAALKLCGQEPLRLSSGHMVLQRRFMGLRVAMLPRAQPPPDLPVLLRDAGLHRTPLILSPETRSPLPRCLRLRKPQELALLALHPDKDACRAALHPKWRNQLRNAEKRNLKIKISRLPADPSHPVLASETRQSRARRYRSWPAPLTAAFAAAAPDQTCLLAAYDGSDCIAHMLFLIHGSRATYHISHTTDAGRAASAHNLLLWRGLRKLARKGVRTLDLGVLSPETPDLNRFKMRTGAVATKTGGTHLLWSPVARP